MEELQKIADLLVSIDASEAAERTSWSEPTSSSSEEDPEVEEWVSLLFSASPGLMQKARLRVCTAGLIAVHRHITTHPHSD